MLKTKTIMIVITICQIIQLALIKWSQVDYSLFLTGIVTGVLGIYWFIMWCER